MSNIHVSLTPKLNDYVQSLLESGLYGNVSEIIREALRKQYQADVLQNNQKLSELQKEVQIGLDQAKNKKFSDINLETLLGKIQNK
jgi:antitoxin ParD1/3/4